jgi:hypothetical protein
MKKLSQLVPDGYCFYRIHEDGDIRPWSSAIAKHLHMEMQNGAIAIEAHNSSHAFILNEYVKKVSPERGYNFQMLDPMHLL